MKKLYCYAAAAAVALSFTLVAEARNALNFRATLSGAQEVPPVVTDASGRALIHVDQRLTEMRFTMNVRNATNFLGVAGAHLHCAPAGVNGPVVVFLAGDFMPGFSGDFEIRATLTDQSIINGACGATIADLAEAMAEGNVYINVHSPANPGGEIRGQIE